MAKKKQNISRQRVLWRYGLVSSLVLCFAMTIIYCAFRTTVIDVDKWNAKANSELSKVKVLKPLRGDILAADGSILATNLTYYTMRVDFGSSRFMMKEFRQSLDSLCDTLAKYYPHKTKEQWKKGFEDQISRPKLSHNYLLLRDITYEESERLKNFPFFRRSKNKNKTGLTKENRVKRCYPYGDMARRSIGRVSERQSDSTIHGYSGLEYALDSLLYGVPGYAKKVPVTNQIVNWTDKPAVPGYTLTTTIDIAMQDIVENELNTMLDSVQAKWGTVILMEVATGDIKAISNLERDSLTGHYVESMNRAVEGIEPGSVMKTISMVIALEDGFVTDINQVYNIGGSYVYGGGNPIRDSHSPAQLPVSRFLEYSSNIGMTKLVAPHFAKDPNQFRERLRKLGFLDRFNTGIAGERPPHFPPLDLKSGGLVSLGRQTYGYASQIPPLYTCAFYNAVANDGKFVRPRLVRAIHTMDGDSILPVTYVRDSICSVKNARIVRQMLHEVVWGNAGTARMLKNNLVEIAGKTGTSKVAREAKKTEKADTAKNSAAPGAPKAPTKGYIEGRYHLSFCGFFPYEHPKYTCMVVISQPLPQFRGAGATSGKVLMNIAKKLYSRGLLDNTSDYNEEAPHDGRVPLAYVRPDDSRLNILKSVLAVTTIATVKASGVDVPGRVPNVISLGLRQAVEILEGKGYRVKIVGSGHVRAVNPPVGTLLDEGGYVTVTLGR